MNPLTRIDIVPTRVPSRFQATATRLGGDPLPEDFDWQGLMETAATFLQALGHTTMFVVDHDVREYQR